jgi:hypothetical protein
MELALRRRIPGGGGHFQISKVTQAAQLIADASRGTGHPHFQNPAYRITNAPADVL